MSKKKKIIISVVTLILVCATVATCAVALFTNTPDNGDDPQESVTDNTDNTQEDTNTADGSDEIIVPPVEDSTEKPPVDKPLLDVSDMITDPNPSVIDSKIEYGTKEVESNAE